MRLRAVGMSHVGLVRSRNEDEWLILNTATGRMGDVADGLADGPWLLAVIDGMGGVLGGDLAARITANTLREEAPEGPVRTPEKALRRLAQLAHENVHLRADREPELHGMGAVATMALLQGARLSVLQIGDTRLYRIRGGELEQLTSDQTFIADMVALGRLTAQQARRHPMRSQVDQAIGVQDLRPVFLEADLASGDRLLMCTDGLTEMLPDSALRQILTKTSEPARAAESLIDGALTQGGRDNVTVVIADILGGDQAE